VALNLPNEWEARDYQSPLFQYMFEGGLERKRAAVVWHRRCGKDSCCLQLSAVASQMRIGTIWHMLPTLKQGRRVIWDGIDREGRRMIDQAFPREMRQVENPINNSDMQIRFRNGSIYQVVGSDNYDSLVGTNPVGVIFSEFAVADPKAWDYIRPILAENGGWALFIYTPRGKNHGKKLFDMAQGNPRWFDSMLTVDDTFRPDGTHVIGPDIIAEERAEGMSEEKILQEYFCSFEAGMEGAFYTLELNLAEEEGRIGDYPHDPTKRVQTYWDIGFRDATSIIFTQRGDDGKPIIIDYLEGRNKALDAWIRDVRSLPYDYDEHWGPHDLENTDFTTGKTRREFASSLDFAFDIVPKIPVQDGIDAARAIIRVARFNESKVGRLIDGLYSYRREYDDRLQMFRDKPLHDWASHPADAMRYLSVGWRDYVGGHKVTSAQFGVKRSIKGKQQSQKQSAMDKYPWMYNDDGTLRIQNGR